MTGDRDSRSDMIENGMRARTILIQAVGDMNEAVFIQVATKASVAVVSKVFWADMNGKELGYVDLERTPMGTPFDDALEIRTAEDSMKLLGKVHVFDASGFLVARRRENLAEIAEVASLGSFLHGLALVIILDDRPRFRSRRGLGGLKSVPRGCHVQLAKQLLLLLKHDELSDQVVHGLVVSGRWGRVETKTVWQLLEESTREDGKCVDAKNKAKPPRRHSTRIRHSVCTVV